MELQIKLLNASDYGVPQLRPRAVIVGIEKSNSLTFNYPDPDPGRAKTVGETLEPLKDNKTEEEVEGIKELIYQISYSAQKNGFRIGVSFVIKFLAEICGTVEIKN